MPVTISGGTLSGGTTATGGGDTGGYDVLGTGAVNDPTRGGQVTLADISGGDSDDQAYVDAIRQNVAGQVALSQNYRDMVDQGRNIDYQSYFDLARRGGTIPSQFGSGGSAFGSAFNPLSFGVLGQLGKFIGQYSSRNLMEGLEKGYIPQYNAIGQIVGTFNPETGQYGAGTVRSRIDPNNPRNTILDAPTEQGDDNPPMIMGGGDGSTAPEVAPEVSMISPELRYPAGGTYPEEGQFIRTGLLDIAPTTYGGLLAGYDQPQFAEMNVGFRQPTDVGLFDDPYDVTGYSLV